MNGRERTRYQLPSTMYSVRPAPRRSIAIAAGFFRREGMTRKQRIGVIGTFVWDVIHGRDARAVPVEEWGGITYSLSALDAALPADWEIVPIMKVGHDLAARAREVLSSLRHLA